MFFLNTLIGYGGQKEAPAADSNADTFAMIDSPVQLCESTSCKLSTLSDLTLGESKPCELRFKRYGWRPDTPDFRDHYYMSAMVNPAKSIDLRPAMPPVYDQGRCGSCTANAIAAALEYDEKKQALADATTPSRLFIYYNERALEGTTDTDSGAAIRDGIKTVANQGFCSEVDWPYDITKFTNKPPQACYDAALKHKAVVYKRVTQSLYQLMDVLSSGYPIVCGISVYDSFEADDTVRTGNVPMPDKNERLLGGHAILLCGYNNAKRFFIFRNSWGTSFGDAGYGTIPFKYILSPDLCQDFWNIRSVS